MNGRSLPMAHFCAFNLTPEGHVIAVTPLQCEEDEAKTHARRLATDGPVELRQGLQLIARYEPQREP